MDSSVEGQQLPLWFAATKSRRVASIVIFLLWVTSFALLAGAVVCPSPKALRLAEFALARTWRCA